MTKADLMKFVGKKVFVYFKGGERGIYGTLGYVYEFSAKYDYRKPNYFYIGNTSFKVSHVRKLAEREVTGNDANMRDKKDFNRYERG